MYEAIVRKIFKEIGVNDDGNVLDFHITNTTFDDIWQNETLTTKYNKFVDYRVSMESGQPLQLFWMSILEMVELLLNMIYTLRAGDRLLLIECISLTLPYTFGYDHVNYARYLTAMLGDMLQLPEDFPDVYEEFLNGSFLAQLTSSSTFSQVETNKVIQMTLNKDTKTPGKLSVCLGWVICKTHILGKIISLCFKIWSVYVYIPSFYSYVILTKTFI